MILIVAMVAMIAVRIWVPNSTLAAPIVEAVAKAGPSGAPAPADPQGPGPALQAPGGMPESSIAIAPEPDAGDAPSGNAFVARLPPPPVAPPAPTQLVQAITAPVPEPPPPDPAPPFQVIGTWDDSSAPGVFVATPKGVEFVRVGTRLGAEYQVTALTPQILTLKQITSKREYQLPVPTRAAQ